MPIKDPIKRRAHHKRYMQEYLSDPANYKKHLARVKRNTDKRRNEIRVILKDFKKFGCVVCGEMEICCLSAHHVRKKLFTPGASARLGKSPSEVKRELKKCVCLCENCHRKVHAGVITLCRQVAKAPIS